MPENVCEDFRRALTVALDGSGTLEPAKERISHLMACEGCVDWFIAARFGGQSDPDLQAKRATLYKQFTWLALGATSE